MTTIIAIDPGYEASAFLLFDGLRVCEHGIEANDRLARRLHERAGWLNHVAVGAVIFEQMESFGMPLGREVLETVFWTGRLFEVARRVYGPVVDRLARRAVKTHLCGSARATDANVRVALCDRFGGSRAIGRKASPGPLYGLKSHEFSALAIALTWWDLHSATAKASA